MRRDFWRGRRVFVTGDASYRQPVETHAVNVMGTVYLLEALRSSESVPAVVTVTSDKCYENRDRSGPIASRSPRALARGEAASIRNPDATRPWHFVLDPLAGHLSLAEALVEGNGLVGEWNFGPNDSDLHPVHWIADRVPALWGENATWRKDMNANPAGAFTLRLDSSRARRLLGWSSRVPLPTALQCVVEWHPRYAADPTCARELLDRQIDRFEAAAV